MAYSSIKVRDSQRIRVYRANSAVLGTNLPQMSDVRMFCHDVVSSNLYRSLFPNKDVWSVPHLKPGKGARTAHVLWHDDGRIEIAFPRMYRYGTYILHELTHYGLGLNDSIAPHGPEFVGAWLVLVRKFCSTRTTHALERALVKEKVRFYIPLTSVKSILKIDQLVLFD